MSDCLQLHYALYERMPNGYQWTWRAEDLKDSLLDDFRYRIRMPDDANTVGTEHLHGGILKFAQVHGSKVDEHVVLYRFYNAGSDEGRSRVTMLTAWARTDQVPVSPAADGILEFFRTPMFEDVSDQARTIGIEQPLFLIRDEPLPAAGDAPSAALAEFLRGLTDEDHDYSLTIQNDNHAVQKTPSAAFKFREAEAVKRKREDEQRRADQIKQETQRQADKKKREDEEAEKQKHERNRVEKEKREQARKNRIRHILKSTMILIGVVLSVFVGVVLLVHGPWSGSWNSPRLSPAAQQVVDHFMKLSPDDQRQVLPVLLSLEKGQTRGPLPMPGESNSLKRSPPTGLSPLPPEKKRGAGRPPSGDAAGRGQDSPEQ